LATRNANFEIAQFGVARRAFVATSMPCLDPRHCRGSAPEPAGNGFCVRPTARDRAIRREQQARFRRARDDGDGLSVASGAMIHFGKDFGDGARGGVGIELRFARRYRHRPRLNQPSAYAGMVTTIGRFGRRRARHHRNLYRSVIAPDAPMKPSPSSRRGGNLRLLLRAIARSASAVGLTQKPLPGALW